MQAVGNVETAARSGWSRSDRLLYLYYLLKATEMGLLSVSAPTTYTKISQHKLCSKDDYVKMPAIYCVVVPGLKYVLLSNGSDRMG